jgi:hypothetical protein
MNDPTKPKKANMPNFLRPRTRPRLNAILPYEIYNTNPVSEVNVIKTLKEMENIGIIKTISSNKKNEEASFYYPINNI